MPKYRKLHTKTVESLDINDMPDDFTRLMWVLLPLGLCSEGRGLDNPAWIKSKIFPLRLDVTPEMIGAAMDWYAHRGMVRRYTVDGRDYFCIPTWHKYQGDTQREAESDYPPPPEMDKQNSRPTHDLLTTSSRSHVDAHVDAHAQGDACTQSPPTPPTGETPPSGNESQEITPTLRHYMDVYHVQQFETADEIRSLLQVESEVGSERVCAAIDWAARKGFRDAGSIATAARNWKAYRSATGPPDKFRSTVDEMAALLERND